MILVELQEWMGGDASIADAAWTSSFDLSKKKTRSIEDVSRVVNLLADSKHSVPFESVIFRFWYRLPIAIDRQHMTHRIASHSGMSGRYRTMPNDWYGMPQDIKEILSYLEGPSLSNIDKEYEDLCRAANDWYVNTSSYFKTKKEENLLSNESYKRLREFIRGVLPQHNMTERVSVFNLRSFCNYYKLRSKSDAQPEIRFMAEAMLQKIKESNVCPIAIQALERNNWSI